MKTNIVYLIYQQYKEKYSLKVILIRRCDELKLTPCYRFRKEKVMLFGLYIIRCHWQNLANSLITKTPLTKYDKTLFEAHI